MVPIKRADILRILRENRPELRSRYHVASLSLFGSYARDEARPDSDVDLLVEFSQPIGLFEFIELQQQLESLLGRKVDLGTRRSLKSTIKDQVLQEAIRVA
jgi:predicted nucleotidyltransferase